MGVVGGGAPYSRLRKPEEKSKERTGSKAEDREGQAWERGGTVDTWRL